MTEVTQAHCDGHLQAVSYGVGGSGRRLSPATLTMSVRAPQMLALYGEILDQHYRDGFTPWGGRGPDVVAGYQRPYGNRVPPVPDTLLRPLQADTLYLVNTIAPLLAAESPRRGPSISGKPLHANIFRHGSSACCARRSARASPATSRHRSCRRADSPGRLGCGWDPNDPLLHLAWNPVEVSTHGGGRNAGGAHLTATFAEQLMITLYDQPAALTYAYAWRKPEDEWVFDKLPALARKGVAGHPVVLGPALTIRAHGHDDTNVGYDAVAGSVRFRIGSLTWSVLDRAAADTIRDAWRYVGQLAPIVLPKRAPGTHCSPTPRRRSPIWAGGRPGLVAGPGRLTFRPSGRRQRQRGSDRTHVFR